MFISIYYIDLNKSIFHLLKIEFMDKNELEKDIVIEYICCLCSRESLQNVKNNVLFIV